MDWEPPSVTADSCIEPILNRDFGWGGNYVDEEEVCKFWIEGNSFIFACTIGIWDIF